MTVSPWEPSPEEIAAVQAVPYTLMAPEIEAALRGGHTVAGDPTPTRRKIVDVIQAVAPLVAARALREAAPIAGLTHLGHGAPVSWGPARPVLAHHNDRAKAAEAELARLRSAPPGEPQQQVAPRDALAKIAALVRNDAWAISFLSLGGYREALFSEIARLRAGWLDQEPSVLHSVPKEEDKS